jgi:hypothetical protein
MKMESWRPTLLRRGDTPGSTWAKDKKKQLMVMESELSGRPSSETALPPKRLSSRTEPSAPYTIDIAAISPHPFYSTMKRKENEHFYTSIYNINRELESRNESAITDESGLRLQDQQLGEAELQWLRRLLPEEFKEYADVFLKEASNVLPPLRAYNHKIQLQNPEDIEGLGYSPLRKQSTQQLLEVKRFLEENLKKGFIEDSSAPFASPILFVKKHDGSLRFCVDFRKLNGVTRKDRYPLPLIDETLSRLAKAKIYTKLDIRQAFHRIRMDPDLEELTTFRTRYGTYKCKVLWEGLYNGPATY